MSVSFSSAGIAESFRLPARAKAKVGTFQMRRSRSAEPASGSIRRFSGLKRSSPGPSPDSSSLPAFVRWTQALLPKRARSSQPLPAGPARRPPQSARSARNLMASGKSAKQPAPAQRQSAVGHEPAQRQRPKQQPPRQRQQQPQQLRTPSSRITYVRSQESSQSNYLRPTVSGRSSLGQYASFQYTPSADSTSWEFNPRPAAGRSSGPDALEADERDIMMTRMARRASKTQAADRPLSPPAQHPGWHDYYHTAARPASTTSSPPQQHNNLQHGTNLRHGQPEIIPYRRRHADSYPAHAEHAHAARQAVPYTWRHADTYAAQPAPEPQPVRPVQQPLPYRRRHADAYTAQQEYLSSSQRETVPHASSDMSAKQGDWLYSKRAPAISGPPPSYYPGNRMHSQAHADAAYGAKALRPQPADDVLVPNGIAEVCTVPVCMTWLY